MSWPGRGVPKISLQGRTSYDNYDFVVSHFVSWNITVQWCPCFDLCGKFTPTNGLYKSQTRTNIDSLFYSDSDRGLTGTHTQPNSASGLFLRECMRAFALLLPLSARAPEILKPCFRFSFSFGTAWTGGVSPSDTDLYPVLSLSCSGGCSDACRPIRASTVLPDA